MKVLKFPLSQTVATLAFVTRVPSTIKEQHSNHRLSETAADHVLANLGLLAKNDNC